MFFFHLYPQNLETRILNPLLGQEFWYENPPFPNIPITISKTSFAITRSLLRATKTWTHMRVRWFLFWLHSANSSEAHGAGKSLMNKWRFQASPKILMYYTVGWGSQICRYYMHQSESDTSLVLRTTAQRGGLSHDVYFVNRHCINEVSPGVVWRGFYCLGLVTIFFFFDCGKAHYKIDHLSHLKCTE